MPGQPQQLEPKKPLLNADIVFAFFVGGILMVLLFPLPKIILDVLLVCNISIALMILLMMFYLHQPLDFSSFPSMLLILTLFRLSLNVASTKLILLDGEAGNVITAFGEFVIGGNYVVGTVVFMILVVIQFMVITKGAGRIAEVGARFTLDAMPGKQMSIDADLNAGIIDEHEARDRREELSAEAEFYGAMDGASKFVKGDAMAGLVITSINIIGGLSIGIFQKNMNAVDALGRYTILTIGDGLVSQIPALITSIGAGILVTKAAKSDGLGGHISGQLFRHTEPMYIASIMLFVLGTIPGLPFVPFFIISSIVFFAANKIKLKQNDPAAKANAAMGAIKGAAGAKALGEGSAEGAEEEAENKPAELTPISPMSLEIGFGLVPLVDKRLNGDLVERISSIREQVKQELGFLIPPISIQDNLELGNNEYRILVRGLERSRGTIQVGAHLAINPGDAAGQIEGVKTKDPAFGFDAFWINPRRVDQAEAKGYTVVDSTSVVTTHVTRIVEDYAADLLTRQGVSDLLELVKKTDKAVVEELVPNQLNIGTIHRVLQFLLAEQVPIHDLPAILETLSDYAAQSKDPLVLCEFCRQALKGHIVSRNLGPGGELCALILNPELEHELQSSVSKNGIMGIAPDRAENVINSVRDTSEEIQERTDAGLVLLVAPALRPHLARLVERKAPDLPVLSYAEVSDDVNLQVLGSIQCEGLYERAAV